MEEEIKVNAYKAAPHELMSAIVSLQEFESIISAKMRSFFARCIIGYKYVNAMDTQKSLMNCLIELLNSKIIDVDKLDYLLRDSYMPMMPNESGYKITLSFCMMHILEKMH